MALWDWPGIAKLWGVLTKGWLWGAQKQSLAPRPPAERPSSAPSGGCSEPLPTAPTFGISGCRRYGRPRHGPAVTAEPGLPSLPAQRRAGAGAAAPAAGEEAGGARSQGPGAAERAGAARHVGPGSGRSSSTWQSCEGGHSGVQQAGVEAVA